MCKRCNERAEAMVKMERETVNREKKNDCFAVYPLIIQDSKSNNTLILLSVCNSKVSLGSPLPNLFTDLSRTM